MILLKRVEVLILRRNPRVLSRGGMHASCFLLRRKPRTLVRGALLAIWFINTFLLMDCSAEKTVSSELTVSKNVKENILTAGKIIEFFLNSYEKVNNFKCTLHEFDKLGKKTDYRVYNYYFMKPRFIRMEVIKGRDRGSVVVFKEGEIYGRKGGMLKWLILRFKLTDRQVTSIRRNTIPESDWEYLGDRVKAYLKMGSLRFIGIENKDGFDCYVLEVEGLNEGGITRRKVWFDSGTYLPVRTEAYERDVLVNHITYSDIQINIGISQGLFSL